jgi:hypothetical protein
MAWGWQTFLLGFPSLGLPEKHVKERERRKRAGDLRVG